MLTTQPTVAGAKQSSLGELPRLMSKSKPFFMHCGAVSPRTEATTDAATDAAKGQAAADDASAATEELQPTEAAADAMCSRRHGAALLLDASKTAVADRKREWAAGARRRG